MGGLKRSAPDGEVKTTKKPKYEQRHDQSSAPKPEASKLKDLNATTSREAHQKQKQQKKERKLAKPNADSIERAKKLWEKLRRKSHVEKEERQKLVAELFQLVTGNINDYVFKHDSVRVIQCALKYANKEQRIMIAQELKGTFRALTESRFGKFLVARLLVTGTDEVKEMIISEFYGKVRHMINHPEAAWILDDTYRQIATPKQKAMLLREWYGHEFAHFKAPESTELTADLVQILEESPAKRRPILKYLFDLINVLVQKKMVGFTMLHDAMLQYSLAVGSPSTSENATEFVELLKGDEEGDLLKNLAFTKSGARVVCRALAYTGAKDRKLLLRVFKDTIYDLAHDAHGIHVLLAAQEVIDDTVMTSKTVISELLGGKLGTDEERHALILEQATNPTARIPLLWPLATGNSKWLVKPSSDTAHLISEMRTLRTETSKKDPETRRTELVKGLSEKGTLLATIEHYAEQLVKESFGCQFVTEVILGCEGDKTAAMTALAELAKGDPNEEGHIAHSSHAGRMLRTLVTGQKHEQLAASEDKQTTKQPRLGFAELLYPRIKSNLLQWTLGDNSFVVANFVEDKGFKDRADIFKKLKKHTSELQESGAKGNKGASILMEAM